MMSKMKLKQTFTFMRNFHLVDEIRNRRHKSKNEFATLHLSAGVEEDGDASLPPTRPPMPRPLLQSHQTAGRWFAPAHL